MVSLASSALQKTQQAFRPSTKKAYMVMFRLFVAFSVFMHFHVTQTGVYHLLVYLEFWSTSQVSAASITNHISALKPMFTIFSLDISPFHDQKIKYFNRALVLDRPFKASLTKIIDIPMLHKIVQQCNFMYMGPIFKPLYLTAFFSFVRISNLVPHSQSAYSPCINYQEVVFSLQTQVFTF